MGSICQLAHKSTGVCRADVLWLVLDTGKRMPVDAKPNDDGNVAAMRDASGNWYGHVLRAGETPTPGERRYMPHFATCEAHKARQADIAARKREDRLVDAAPNVHRMGDRRGG